MTSLPIAAAWSCLTAGRPALESRLPLICARQPPIALISSSCQHSFLSRRCAGRWLPDQAQLCMEDGVIALPQKPGLGIELNRDALEHYRVPQRYLATVLDCRVMMDPASSPVNVLRL